MSNNYFLNENLRYRMEKGLLKHHHFKEEQVKNMTDTELVNLYHFYYPNKEQN